MRLRGAQPGQHLLDRPSTSQCSPSGSSTGSLANRCTSVSSTRFPSTAPTITRPLDAPRSTAT
ncbi:hypothetical protein ACFQX7_01515 [Luedemannella flava]